MNNEAMFSVRRYIFIGRDRFVDTASHEQVEQNQDALKAAALQMWRVNSTLDTIQAAAFVWGLLGLPREDYPYIEKAMRMFRAGNYDVMVASTYGKAWYGGYDAGLWERRGRLHEVGLNTTYVDALFTRYDAQQAAFEGFIATLPARLRAGLRGWGA